MLTLMDPAQNAVDVTPSDSADLTNDCRAIYIGAAGTLKLTMAGGTTVTLAAVNAGVIYPLRASRVWSTGTTATGIVALY